MGHKALIRLLVIFAVIGGIALILKLTGPGKVETVASSTDREKVFADFPINDVAQIRIKSSAQEVNVKKSEGTGWAVVERGDYPADTQAAIEFLRSVWDLKIVQSPEIGESQYSRLSLLDPAKGGEDTAATVVSFLNAEGKELTSLWLGKVVERESGQPTPYGPTTTEAGRYVKTGGEPTVFLIKETFSKIETDPAEWLNEDFFKIEKVKTIEIKSGNPEDDWKLTREEDTGDFTLVGAKEGEELDPVKVGVMKNAFSSPRFEDVIMDGETPDKTTFIIETFGDLTYTVKLSEKSDLNEYFLTFDVAGEIPEKRKPAEEESDEEKKERDEAFAATLKPLKEEFDKEKAMAGKVYKVRSYVADGLIKKRSELLKTEDAEGGAGGPSFTPGSAPPAGTPGSIPGLPEGLIPSLPQQPKAAAPGTKPAEKKKLPDPKKADAPKAPTTQPEKKPDAPKAAAAEPKPAAEKPAAKKPAGEKPAAESN